jgi:hypothetical protein
MTHSVVLWILGALRSKLPLGLGGVILVFMFLAHDLAVVP